MDLEKKDNNDSLKISKTSDEFNINIPIGKPDQETTNDIWKIITGAGIALAGVGVALTGALAALFFSNKNDES